MNHLLAPVVVFAYNRPDFLQATLQSLSENEWADRSELFIYCDGPKAGATQQQIDNIEHVRVVAKSKSWCKKVEVIEAPVNKGLANSVISGVTETLNQYENVIVIEDDVLLSKFFLRFMNTSLARYANEDQVLSIGSWNYFCNSEKLEDNFFLRYPDSIAWGTFKRAWSLFEKDGAYLLDQLKEKKLLGKLNCSIPEKYFEKMLVEQVDGKIDSWAIRWTALSVLMNKLNYYPRLSMSKHMGFDTSATHETGTKDYNAALELADRYIQPGDQEIKESKKAIREWKKFIVREFIHRPSAWEKTKTAAKNVLPGSVQSVYRKIAK